MRTEPVKFSFLIWFSRQDILKSYQGISEKRQGALGTKVCMNLDIRNECMCLPVLILSTLVNDNQ